MKGCIWAICSAIKDPIAFYNTTFLFFWEISWDKDILKSKHKGTVTDDHFKNRKYYFNQSTQDSEELERLESFMWCFFLKSRFNFIHPHIRNLSVFARARVLSDSSPPNRTIWGEMFEKERQAKTIILDFQPIEKVQKVQTWKHIWDQSVFMDIMWHELLTGSETDQFTDPVHKDFPPSRQPVRQNWKGSRWDQLTKAF